MVRTLVPTIGCWSGILYQNGNQTYAELDFETGKLINKVEITIDPYAVLPNAENLSLEVKKSMMERIGNPFNAMQMAGLFDGNGIFYQGTKLGILKISTLR